MEKGGIRAVYTEEVQKNSVLSKNKLGEKMIWKLIYQDKQKKYSKIKAFCL